MSILKKEIHMLFYGIRFFFSHSLNSTTLPVARYFSPYGYPFNIFEKSMQSTATAKSLDNYPGKSWTYLISEIIWIVWSHNVEISADVSSSFRQKVQIFSISILLSSRSSLSRIFPFKPNKQRLPLCVTRKFVTNLY